MRLAAPQCQAALGHLCTRLDGKALVREGHQSAREAHGHGLAFLCYRARSAVVRGHLVSFQARLYLPA